MTDYQSSHKVKNETMDNIRRVYSSFYNFLEDEEYILRSPVKKLHKIKGEKTLKQPFTDEDIMQIFDACYTVRERAMIDFLYITGVRVSELCKLNISDIDFEHREVIVMGKGSKERVVYFDAQTKLHLEQYLIPVPIFLISFCFYILYKCYRNYLCLFYFLRRNCYGLI